MKATKVSTKLYSLAKSVAAAAILPVFLLYIMVDKPDYKIMNGLSHIVLPVANWVGDVVSWPIRAVGNAATGIRELSNLRDENEELRAQLTEATRRSAECDVALVENQRLTREIDVVRATPQQAIVASVTYNNEAFSHNTFFVNKGTNAGITNGMAVVSFDGMLIGVVNDAGFNYARVRALTDSKSNIPVRIAGTQVYGFLAGNGSASPTMGFFSDPEFQPTPGLKLVTSGIRGVLPDGIIVGELKNDSDATVMLPTRVSNVMVLQFDNKDKYK